MSAKVISSYALVVLIWSTTPLTIVWSSESVHPTMAVLLRMLIAAVLGLLVIWIRRINFPWDADSRRLYAYSAIGIFCGMLFAYMSARYLTSGVISLVFGTSPVIAGILSNKLLGEAKFSRIKKVGLVVSLAGLAVVVSDRLSLDSSGLPGIVLILMAVFFFSYSSVLVKTVNIQINPVATTVGALLVTLPFYTLTWYLLDGTLPVETWQARSIGSIIYLGVFGSLVGFVAYYYVLQRMSPSTVALVTLMTPVFALIIGAVFNNETISTNLLIGAFGVLTGLFMFVLGDRLIKRIKSKASTPN